MFVPLAFLLSRLSPVSLSSEEIRFVIALDEEPASTVQKLKEQNFIRSDKLFTFLLNMSGRRIEPGAYMLKKNYWLPKTIHTLLYRPYQKWMLLKPGLRKEQVAEILTEKFSWNPLLQKEFLDNAPEGYLFPDTYLINVSYSPKEVVQKLVNNFNEKFDAQLQKDLLAQNVRNDTAVKIASLIERESGSLEDKPLIAGIIWNRLNDGMKLQIDATTQYILGTRGNWWPRIKPQDHKSESLYNTYIHKGLPPGPIANPSLESLKAAVYPSKTDCLFYLHGANKQIHCAKTYRGHLENINRYLK